jgi:hypothetical protein
MERGARDPFAGIRRVSHACHCDTTCCIRISLYLIFLIILMNLLAPVERVFVQCAGRGGGVAGWVTHFHFFFFLRAVKACGEASKTFGVSQYKNGELSQTSRTLIAIAVGRGGGWVDISEASFPFQPLLFVPLIFVASGAHSFLPCLLTELFLSPFPLRFLPLYMQE